MEKKLEDYSEKKLIKEIKLQGALIIIFAVSIFLFGFAFIYDLNGEKVD